jgi:hypothetical protein
MSKNVFRLGLKFWTFHMLIMARLRAGRSRLQIPPEARKVSVMQNVHPDSYSVGTGVIYRG